MPSSIPNLATCKKLGFIVPSSNTVVEPTCNALIAAANASTASTDQPEVLCLYTRIRVKTVGTDSNSTSQFNTSTLVEAAKLLADAECDAILWNGTSGMWVGADLSADEALARAMHDATGIPCSTTTLATVAALRENGWSRIALAVPYTAALTAKLEEFFRGCGFGVVRSERLGETPGDNLAIGRCEPKGVKEVVERAGGGVGEGERPDAVLVACTNWRGAEVVQPAEEDLLGSAVVDSITVTVWQGLRMMGWKGGFEGWGRLMKSI